MYGYRPHFPLAGTKPPDFDSIPADARSYVRLHAEKLSIIRTEVRNNVIKAQISMLDRARENILPLQVSQGDYVYLFIEVTGAGQKFKNKFTGPFVIEKITCPYLVLLRYPDTTICLKTPVYLYRLKMAYVREPNPKPYFMSKVVTHEQGPQTDRHTNDQPAPINDQHATAEAEVQTNEHTVEYTVPDLRCSTRQRNPPNRFGIYLKLDTVISSD